MKRGILSSVVRPYHLLLAWGSLTTVFFLAGRAGNAPCTVTPKCRMWGLHQGSPVGPKALWTVCLVSYPLNTPSLTTFVLQLSGLIFYDLYLSYVSLFYIILSNLLARLYFNSEILKLLIHTRLHRYGANMRNPIDRKSVV